MCHPLLPPSHNNWLISQEEFPNSVLAEEVEMIDQASLLSL
jgi:hypothetical protein